jgi:5-methylcytosine-specific restriction endonuclease McrA
MNVYISSQIREEVKFRAGYVCEYCLLHEKLSFFTHEIDHVISLKHGGSNDSDNMAYSCSSCNRNKGSDIGSLFERTYIRFFNPRLDQWKDHFFLDDGVINPIIPIGEVTVKILQINSFERIMERRAFAEAGLYP